MATKRFNTTLRRLAAAEASLFDAQILAPVVRGQGISVRLASIRCKLTVQPEDFRGWGIFRPTSYTSAELVRPATELERRRYLSLFAKVRLIVTARWRGDAVCTLAEPAGTPFFPGQTIVVRDAREGQIFESVIGRFDGGQVWFDDVDPRTDPSIARYLREQLSLKAKPDSLDKSGLTTAHRSAYAGEFARRQAIAEAGRQTRVERRLRTSLAQAGAQFNSLAEVGDAYRVDYSVDGECYTSVVRGDDTAVISAGICLSGMDRDFDLNSLVGVLRESVRE